MYILYTMDMKTVSTTNARKNISFLIDTVRETGESIALGRHDRYDALLIKFPRDYNKAFSEIANLNAYSSSFDFLKDEPDLYTMGDIKKKYV